MRTVIILIAGNSSRINSINVPKQFYICNNKPLFVYTTEAFNNSSLIDDIILVCKKECIDEVKNYVNKFNLNKVKYVIEGGKVRQESVYKGLTAKEFKDDDTILIHDGARPFVDEEIIKNNIETCEKYEACVTATKAVDTLLQEDESTISSYLNRDQVYQLQTPQTFKYKVIYKAHLENINQEFSDDSSLVNKYQKVHIVNGSKLNFKVTTNEDIVLFEAIIKSRN